MAMLGSGLPSEVGLRLLLAPLSSNVVLRTACCTVGIGLPVYSTFKAIQSARQEEQQKWLLYWAAYGSFSIVESFADKFIYWFPFYYHMKFAFLVWLQFPNADGAKQLYVNYLRPFLVKHQTRLDHVLGLVQIESVKFASSYKAEFEFVKKLFSRLLLSPRDIVHPGQQVHGAIEGLPTGQQVLGAIEGLPTGQQVLGAIEGLPTGQVEDSESEDEEQ